MDLERVKWQVGSALAFALRYWYLVGALLLFLVVGYTVDSCRTASIERKKDRIEANIAEQEVIANVLANQKNAAVNEVQRNEGNSNDARRELDNSRRTDSGVFAGANAEDKFCRRFCLDSSCLEWRKRNPNYACN